MVVVIDTCSLHRLVEYYLPLDKSGKLIPLLEELFLSRNIVMTKAVHDECSHTSQGVIVKKLPFLSSKEFKNLIVKEDYFLPDTKFLRIINDHFLIKAKFNSLLPEQQEAQRESYLHSGDFSLLLCAYMENKGMAGSLFADELWVLTDESANENDNKCFKKIPTCCKILETPTINIREYLEKITNGKIEVIITQ